jgi:hypothetical protein
LAVGWFFLTRLRHSLSDLDGCAFSIGTLMNELRSDIETNPAGTINAHYKTLIICFDATIPIKCVKWMFSYWTI